MFEGTSDDRGALCFHQDPAYRMDLCRSEGIILNAAPHNIPGATPRFLLFKHTHDLQDVAHDANDDPDEYRSEEEDHENGQQQVVDWHIQQ